MPKRALALLFFCLTAGLVLPALAAADSTDIIEPQIPTGLTAPSAKTGWQAATCDTAITEEPTKCSPETPNLFFTTAAGHPPVGFTQYIVQHTVVVPNVVEPLKTPLANRDIKTLRVDLPPGLTVNPNAAPEKCSLADFQQVVTVAGEPKHRPNCGDGSVVGRQEVTLVSTVPNFPTAGNPTGVVVAPAAALGTKVKVFDLEPNPGEPALFGFVIAEKEEIFLETEVAWESDFHESFTIHLPASEPPLATLISRLVNFGQTGDGTYIANPTTCFDPHEAAFEHLYSTWFRAESHGQPNRAFPVGSTAVEAKVEDSTGELNQQEGCDTVPFNPGVDVEPGTQAIDSPAGPTVNTTLDYLTGAQSAQQESQLRKAVVTLPAGMGLNPSGAQGLQACTDEQFKKGVRDFNNKCPAASEVGTATVESPPLTNPLTGKIYVGEQQSTDPTSGKEFRILVEAKEPDEGVALRLVGEVAANPKTGQLTTTFDEQEFLALTGEPLPRGLPQAPFTSVKLHFDAAKAVLTSPSTCSAAKTSGQMTPWARPDEAVPVSSEFTLTVDPAGGACPNTLAERKFTPAYTTKSDSAKAGAFSPFRVHIARKDGEQELKVVDVTLPKGLTGKLAGIPYCSEAAIAAAMANSGKAEIADASCSPYSQVGSVETTSGTGGNPLKLGGKVYLAGPYKNAPLSLVTVTPAVAGPFDLGTVVVRVALNLDPETAQIHPVSDVIPDVFGGVKLDIRAIDFIIDRDEFMLNPTNCSEQATTGALNGGGGDPTNPAAFSSYAVNFPFQAQECNSLGFKPKLSVKLTGPTQRAKNPRLTATLTARKGDANIAATTLIFPHTLFLDQAHIGTVCTRPNLAAHTCPAASVYGTAEAESPLLKDPLKGQVYLVPSKHKLPDLLVDLRGQVEVYLRATVGSKHGGLKSVFSNVPDVPVSKFVLRMKGGKKSLLENSDDLCRHAQRAVLKMKGQNGKKANNNKFKLTVAGCGKQKKHKK
jgi:hypothetical protein